jgi:hypothetical protein
VARTRRGAERAGRRIRWPGVPTAQETAMIETQQIREHMDVADADGRHVGTVDCVKNDRLVLTRSDSLDDKHHAIAIDQLDRIEGGKLYLKQNAQVPQGV